jgi:hypothetical protein
MNQKFLEEVEEFVPVVGMTPDTVLGILSEEVECFYIVEQVVNQNERHKRFFILTESYLIDLTIDNGRIVFTQYALKIVKIEASYCVTVRLKAERTIENVTITLETGERIDFNRPMAFEKYYTDFIQKLLEN